MTRAGAPPAGNRWPQALTAIALLAAALGAAAGCRARTEGGIPAPSAGRGAEAPLQEGGADRGEEGDKATAPARPFTGILRSGFVGIGGEHTGWALVTEEAPGGLELDLSRVFDEARRLDGLRVTIVGRIVSKEYVERGVVQILVAEAIEPAPDS